MVALQIRHVPEEIRDVLSAEAERRGESLQTYLHDLLVREAASASNRALARHWMTHPVRAELTVDVTELLARQRDERERQLTHRATAPHHDRG
jgi:hypothetical protein